MGPGAGFDICWSPGLLAADVAIRGSDCAIALDADRSRIDPASVSVAVFMFLPCCAAGTYRSWRDRIR